MNRILIVDDEAPLAEALRDLFAFENIVAATAASRLEAEQMLSEEEFAVVLADVRLRNEEEGLRLLESVRRISPKAKIATMTGYATPTLEAQLRALGARQILYKPFDFDELLRVIRELLGDDSADAAPPDLDTLYADVRGLLYSLPLRRFGLTTDDAEDVVQQAWLLFLEKRGAIRQPRAWLAGTVANLCRQRLDDRQRMVPTEDSLFEGLADARARGAEAVLTVRAVLEAADERTRDLCSLIALEELSYEEVSARLGIPLGSVGPLYIRAKAKLRKMLVG